VQWCEAVLGITPGPGGEHVLMGTHNRLFGVGSSRFPRAYLEIIAIDPAAAPPARTRWFDLDQPALQVALAHGPALVHWVASCDDIHAEVASLRGLGIDRGEVLSIERATPRGLLRWQMSVRPDGQRLADGALPTLIEWGDVHPADVMPASGVMLERLALNGLPAATRTRLPAGVEAATDVNAAPLVATLATPRGVVRLASLQPPT
jgi:hypothetical protein